MDWLGYITGAISGSVLVLVLLLIFFTIECLAHVRANNLEKENDYLKKELKKLQKDVDNK